MLAALRGVCSLQGITDNTQRDRVGVTEAATASNPYYATSGDVLIIAPTTLYHHRVVEQHHVEVVVNIGLAWICMVA